MTADHTLEMLDRYLESNHTDLSMMDDDVVFTTMATGEEHVGRETVRQMLHHMYHVAFDARAVRRSVVCAASHAVFEAVFVGRHIAEFAGVPATGRDVRIPLCVVYDVRDRRITRARVYFEVPAFLAQVRAPAPSVLSRTK
jgi:steroid delta-isomerase-like uncharacterized protein